MAISKQKAKTLLNRQEFKLFEEAGPKQIKNWNEEDLTTKIRLARKYRDKARTQWKKQRILKKREGIETVKNRSRDKLDIFSRCVNAFETAHQKLKQKRLLEKKKELKREKREQKKKKRATKSSKAKKPIGSTAPVGLRKSQRFEMTAQKRIMGHLRAAGRRRQGKRDSR
ncbi:MAG: hypothetical protein EA369_06860 [Bradymonadales bacterium]|nr:MAG: hypothetical protein EA369_06860 [Bradymonadales bacterium]